MSSRKKEPIAIIGLGCRLPGGSNSPQAYWNLLRLGKDAIIEVPADRWNAETYYSPNPKAPGKTVSRWGGFIDSIEMFDARFFGISPREAVFIDPQQRILLESVWQALEDGGQVPERLAGTPVGVFLGISGCDYRDLIRLDLHCVDGHTGTGVAQSVAANRISYYFDFKGPSFVVDTACSSALVATHLACRSIWNGESSMAVAGGVNALLTPDVTITLGKGGMLSPDGRCRSFDAAGNGYVRGEGAGVAILKPLQKALQDKDPIYALILSSTSNQDGRTLAMPVPNGESQKTLLREGCATAGISPHQIQYLEAHGTGTPIGDPIEANAQGEVLSENRPSDDVCYMGSVKSNIGHLESASGVAGLIKVALALKHKEIPPNLHFNQPHPEIDFEKLQLQVPESLIPWPKRDEPALAGINSFGFGGTNANLILQEFPPPIDSESPDHFPNEGAFFCLPVSARSQEALEDFARRYIDYFSVKDDWTGSELQDVCYTASLRRSHHDHRLALTGQSAQDFKDGLQAFLNDDKHPGLSSGKKISQKKSSGLSTGIKPSVEKVSVESPEIVFVFSGQGPQWWGMGRQLVEQEPVFRATIKKCDELFSRHADWSLLEELMAEESQSKINETHLTQPALFSLQVGLVDLWRSWGIEPSAVIGHSIGEAAAAYVAGIYSLEDAVRVVYHRGRWLHKMAGKGKMAVVGIPEGKAASMLKGWENKISLAAVNSPKSVTVSGDPEALEKMMEPLGEKEIFCRYLQVNYAFHSHQMDSVQKDLLKSLNGLQCQAGSIPFYSTVRGKSERGDQMGADYWWDNVRNPVRFYKATEELILDGFTTFLELSPHPVLGANISECLSHLKRQGTVIPSLKHKEDDRKVMVNSLGNLYSLGRSIDWNKVFPHGGRCVSLPHYPWQRERHWHEREEKGYDQLAPGVHPFLGWEMEFSSSGWQSRIDKRDLTYLGDHIVKKLLIFPGAGFIEWALALSSRVNEGASCVLESVEFQNALVLPKNRSLKTQMTHDPADGSFKIHSLSDRANQTWTLHASGTLGDQFNHNAPEKIDLEKIKSRCVNEVVAKELYETFEKMGLFYGPAFQGVERSFRGEGEALALLKSPKALGLDVKPYQIHPAILDAAFQVSALLALESEELARKLFLPVSVDRFQLNGSPKDALWVHVKAVNFDSSQAVVDLTMFDDSGKIWVECQGLHFRALNPSKGRDLQDPENWLYQWRWEPCIESGPETQGSDAAFLPSSDQLTSFLEKNLEDMAPVLNRSGFYDSIEPQFNRLSAGYVLGVLKKIAPDFESLKDFSTGSFIEQFKLNPKHPAYLENCFSILANEGILKKEASRWRMDSCAAKIENPQKIWKSLIGEFPSYLAELNLLRLAGENLADLLTAGSAGFNTIFPEKDAILERLQQSAYSARIYNFQLQKIVSFLLDHLPKGRKLRVLGIGGGGTKAPVFLSHCPKDRVEYIHTESSEEKLEKAVQKLREFSFIEFQTLDLKTSPNDQGFASHTFDLVFGSRLSFGEPQNGLENIKELLASEGLLLELDWNSTSNWLRLILGSCELDSGSANEFARPDGDNFLKKLKEAGFQNVAQWGDLPTGDNSLQTFLIARSPKVSQGNSSQEIKTSKPNKKGSWIIFIDSKGVGQALAESLKNLGENCFLVSPGEMFSAKEGGQIQMRPDSLEDMGDLIDRVRKQGPALRGIVHLWNVDLTETQDLSISSLDEMEARGNMSVIYLVNELSYAKWSKAPRLFIVTQGAQPVQPDEKNISVAQSPVWGIGRVIQSEHSNFKCKIVDIDPDPGTAPANALFDELWKDDKEEEIALRRAGRFVYRLHRPEPKEILADGFVRGKETEVPSFVMDIGTPGILEDFKLRSLERSRPGPGELEIRVCSAGLNFRDVMIGMGLLPGELEGVKNTWETLGLECSGIVSAVGEGVKDFQVGDEVAALSGGGCFGSYAMAPAFATAHKPKQISFEDAATIPVTFLTAWYMLHSAGNLKKGERVLIHAASGGVGMAAVQIAQLAGAEVFATAGNEEKRGFLRDLGVKHIFDSRSLAFAEQIMDQTGGEGVDLVLNSLAGKFIFKSIEILKPLGRFLEIGKRDIYENNKMGLRPFLKGISFITMVDIRQGFLSLGGEFHSIFTKIMRHMSEGNLYPLPNRVFPISNAESAFRTMAQARHMGKVVLSLEEPDLKISQDEDDSKNFSRDATYLITGGLGGFGLAIARWMVQQGARYLALMGRSETLSEEAQSAITEMEGQGAVVRVVRGDVSQGEDVTRILKEIESVMPPLKGIMHGAVVLDDGLMIHLTSKRFKRVMAAKVRGAWNLHQQTRSLDFFVLFSSVANVVGNPGQANYVAANAFLESLARYRRAQGLSGQVIDWGPLSGVGVAARQKGLVKSLENQGLMSLTSRQAVEMLGRTMHKNPVQTGIFPVDWKKLLSLSRSGSNPARFSYVLGDDVQGENAGDLEGDDLIRAKLLAVPPEERTEILGEHLKESIAKVLRLAPSKLEMDLPLTDLGLDSLMAMELIVRIETDLQITVPVVRFLGGPSIDQMVLWLLEEIKNQEDDDEELDEDAPLTVAGNGSQVKQESGG